MKVEIFDLNNITVINEYYEDSETVRERRKIKDGKLISKETFNRNGELHSFCDLPSYYAIVDGKEIQHWHFKGKSHRVNKPAFIEKINGVENRIMYYRYGKLHRKNGPALVNRSNGSVWYRKNGRVKKRPSNFNIFFSKNNEEGYPIAQDEYLK